MARQNIIHLRVNTSELERLQYAAEQQEISMSEVLRDLIKQHLPHPAHVQRANQNPIR